MTEKLSWHKTHCARMDHGGCALLVGKKNGRIVKIKGDPQGYLNRGYICPKAKSLAERLNHPQRLRNPLRRKGKRGEGNWEEISWTEALRIICSNLDQLRKTYGAKSVAFCQGMPKGLEHFALIRLANTFGSPNVVSIQDVCHAPREITGRHICGFYPVADLENPSELTVLWGSNPLNSNEEGQTCPLLLQKLRQGSKLMVIDPRKTKLAAKADFWLQIRPGTDDALALAFLHVIITEGLYAQHFVENWTYGFQELTAHIQAFSPEKMSEITWIEPELIRQCAREYAMADPAALNWGNAIEHHCQTFDTIRSLICLMAICGNLDIPGGNIQAVEPNLLSLGKFVRADLIPEKKREMPNYYHGSLPGFMTVPPAYFQECVLNSNPYPIRGAYMQCTNPLLAYAQSSLTYESLQKLDFLAISDIFLSPSALMADIVLPAASHFEFDDLGHYGLGHGYAFARPKLVEPPENCWPDLKIINSLGQKLTAKELWYSDYREMLDQILAPGGLSFKEFADIGILKGKNSYFKYQAKGFKTPSGKVELCLSKAADIGMPSLPQLKASALRADPDYPLLLTSAKSPVFMHSSYRWIDRLRKMEPEPVAFIHPQTAYQYGIQEGDPVWIETANGKIAQKAATDSSLHPQIVYASYGWWFPEQGTQCFFDWEKSNYNCLTVMQPLGKAFATPNLKGIRCRIKKC